MSGKGYSRAHQFAGPTQMLIAMKELKGGQLTGFNPGNRRWRTRHTHTHTDLGQTIKESQLALDKRKYGIYSLLPVGSKKKIWYKVYHCTYTCESILKGRGLSMRLGNSNIGQIGHNLIIKCYNEADPPDLLSFWYFLYPFER